MRQRGDQSNRPHAPYPSRRAACARSAGGRKRQHAPPEWRDRAGCVVDCTGRRAVSRRAPGRAHLEIRASETFSLVDAARLSVRITSARSRRFTSESVLMRTRVVLMRRPEAQAHAPARMRRPCRPLVGGSAADLFDEQGIYAAVRIESRHASPAAAITNSTPSMVSEVSATLVATTTLRGHTSPRRI